MNALDWRIGTAELAGPPLEAIGRPLMPSLERRRLQCYLALMIADIITVLASFAAAGYLYLGPHGLSESMFLAQLLLPAFLTIGFYHGAYSIAALLRTNRSALKAVTALLISSTVVVFIAFYTKSARDFSRFSFTLGVIAAVVMLVWTRMQMRSFIHWRCGPRVLNELVIDDGGPALILPQAYRVCARQFVLTPALDDPHALDRIGLVMRNADRVIVSTPQARRAAWAVILKGANVAGEVIDETVSELGAQGARLAGGQGLLQVSVGPLGTHDRITKRLFDMVVAVTVLVVLAPLLLLVALAIKAEDRGPVLFVQRRVGRGNRFFSIYKFRSMSVNRLGRDGVQSAARDDSRTTLVGRFIRRSSIDELPQLFNVLRGNMSLVGPRPHAIGSQAGDKLFWEVDTQYWVRHALKPGLTGLAQVRGFRGATAHEADLSGRLTADLEYLNGWSLWRDLGILLATFRVLVHERAF